MISARIGEKVENELIHIFKDKGFFVIKAPLSGRNQPISDLMIPRNGVFYGFEIKFVNKEKALFMIKDFDNIILWLKLMRREGIPARAFLAVKLIDKWFFEEIDINVREIRFPREDAMDLNMLISLLKGRKRISRKFNCSIRIMGDKEDVYFVFNEIKNCFSNKNFKIYAREYVMYKDKKGTQ